MQPSHIFQLTTRALCQKHKLLLWHNPYHRDVALGRNQCVGVNPLPPRPKSEGLIITLLFPVNFIFIKVDVDSYIYLLNSVKPLIM